MYKIENENREPSINNRKSFSSTYRGSQRGGETEVQGTAFSSQTQNDCLFILRS